MTIDRLTCVSCGSCHDACPGFLKENPDDSFSQINEKFRNNGNIGEGTPPGDLEECTRHAAELCPVQIISISG